MSMQKIDGVYVADTARVRGQVELGEGVSLWYGAVVRGDVARVSIGAGTNVQDNAVIHCDTDVPNEIGRDVSIGHAAVVHGMKVGDGTLIGMSATVMGGTRIGSGCLIAAGALVVPGMQVEDGMVVMGVPGRVVRSVNEQEREYLRWLGGRYTELAREYHERPNGKRVRGRLE